MSKRLNRQKDFVKKCTRQIHLTKSPSQCKAEVTNPSGVCDVLTVVQRQWLIKSGEAFVRLCIVLTQVLSWTEASLVSCHLHRTPKGEKKN